MLEDLSKSAAGMLLALIPPVCFAALGRAAHYANMQQWPRLKDTPAEAVIIIFMGAVTGGLGEYLGLTGSVLGAFSASASFFGPRILYTITNGILKRNGVDETIQPLESCKLPLDGKK